MNFLLQPKKLKTLLADAGSRAIMEKTVAFQVVYGQLIFEQAGLDRIAPDIVNQIFDFKEKRRN